MRQRPDLSERNRRNATHGATRNNGWTGEYVSWRAMRARCSPNAKPQDLPRYYGRGIRVCERWNSFAAFLADMGPRPPGGSIERLDNDGNYEPGNCAWRTMKAQSRNRRNSRPITARGETLTIAEWAERLGTSRQTIRHRIEAGWTPEAAVSIPPSKKENSKWRRHSLLQNQPQHP